jgi:hypothetical protein
LTISRVANRIFSPRLTSVPLIGQELESGESPLREKEMRVIFSNTLAKYASKKEELNLVQGILSGRRFVTNRVKV